MYICVFYTASPQLLYKGKVFHYECQILTRYRLRNSVVVSLENPVNPNNYPMSIKQENNANTRDKFM